MKNLKIKFLAISSIAFFSSAFADSAAMVTAITNAVTADQDALWSVGAVIIVLSAIALIINRIKSVTR